jgi:DNA repair protein RadA/Sms
MLVCQRCGWESPRRFLLCQRCGAENTLRTEVPPGPEPGEPSRAQRLDELADAPALVPTGLELWDTALGGYAPGTVFLAGQPGGGKTTLALKLADAIGSALFASSEESPGALRAETEQLGLYSSQRNRQVFFLHEPDIGAVLEEAARVEPALLIVNSVNKCRAAGAWGPPGSSEQIKAIGARVIRWAATHQRLALLIGHITWDGRSQGPRTLEHDVDVVAYLTIRAGQRQLAVHKARPPFRGDLGTYDVPDWTPGASAE